MKNKEIFPYNYLIIQHQTIFVLYHLNLDRKENCNEIVWGDRRMKHKEQKTVKQLSELRKYNYNNNNNNKNRLNNDDNIIVWYFEQNFFSKKDASQ